MTQNQNFELAIIQIILIVAWCAPKIPNIPFFILLLFPLPSTLPWPPLPQISMTIAPHLHGYKHHLHDHLSTIFAPKHHLQTHHHFATHQCHMHHYNPWTSMMHQTTILSQHFYIIIDQVIHNSNVLWITQSKKKIGCVK